MIVGSYTPGSSATFTMTVDDDEVEIKKVLKVIVAARLEGRKIMRSDILPLLGFPEISVDAESNEITGSFTVRK